MSSLFGEEMVLGSFVSRFLPLLVGLIFLSYSKIKYPKKLVSSYSIIIGYDNNIW